MRSLLYIVFIFLITHGIIQLIFTEYISNFHIKDYKAWGSPWSSCDQTGLATGGPQFKSHLRGKIHLSDSSFGENLKSLTTFEENL